MIRPELKTGMETGVPTMRMIGPIALSVAALALSGCGVLDNLGGRKKVSPDEFRIVTHAPLTMPPNAELRPPRPGEARPQESSPTDQAREAIAPQARGRTAPRAPASGEQALVQRATQGAADPNIRTRVNQDSRVLADSDKGLLDDLIFWQVRQPPGTVIDATAEQRRLREAQASGQPASGPTPTIERRKRGLLEGIF